jgi:hypothetical protein
LSKQASSVFFKMGSTEPAFLNEGS